MAELVAGAGKPLSRAEVNGLISRFKDKDLVAAKLRVRVAKGKALIENSDPAKFDLEDARARLAELETELREAEWGELLLIGIALGHGAAALLNEHQDKSAWQPPAGSFVRIKMPGLLDLTVDMVEYGDAGGVTKVANRG